MFRLPVSALLIAGGFATAPAFGQNTDESEPPSFDGFEERAEELSEQAIAAIERFAAMIGLAIDQLPTFFETLPRYEAPEVLPNGDIIIRRVPDSKPKPGTPDSTAQPGDIET